MAFAVGAVQRWAALLVEVGAVVTAWLIGASVAYAAGDRGAGGKMLEPMGKWVVDYQEGMCVLSRHYGAGQDDIELGFRPVPLQQQTEIAMLAARTGTGPKLGTGSWRLDPGKAVTATYESFPNYRQGRRITTLDADAELMAGLPKATRLEIDADRGLLTFHLSSVTAALRALSACQDDLLRHWGLDPDALKTLTRPAQAKGHVASWFGPNEYPQAAIGASAQGRTVAILTLDPQGRPVGCRTAESSGSADLDQATCRIGMRGFYRPGLDAQGVAVASPYIIAVRWVLPH